MPATVTASPRLTVSVTTWPAFRSPLPDRKSTRLNSSHRTIAYAVFCWNIHTGLVTAPLRLAALPAPSVIVAPPVRLTAVTVRTEVFSPATYVLSLHDALPI